jgi:4-amino-4-deoxy-L-arabinose transferase-like glycosyltransferase
MDNKIFKDITFLFVLALLVRISYTLFFVDIDYLLAEDQWGYLLFSQQVSESGFLGMDTQRVPGYPWLISFISNTFGESLWYVIAFQLILDSLTCIMIALMAKSLLGKGFWIAGGLSVMNLNMIILSNSLLTDTLFLFLFVIFLFSLIQYFQNDRFWWFIGLVISISIATLVRGSTYYLLPILFFSLLGWKLWQRDSLLKIGVLALFFVVTVAITLGSIHQRNYQDYGSKALVSQNGTHLLGWIVPATFQYSGQGSYQDGQQLAKARLALALKQDKLEGLPLNPFESSAYKAKVGKDILFEFGFMNMFKAWAVGSSINLMAPSVAHAPALRAIEHPSFYETKGKGIVEKLYNYINDSNGFLYLSVLSIGTIISLLFNLVALFGVIKMAFSLPRRIPIKLLLFIGYFLAITGPIIGVKYRLPIEPILIIFVTYGMLSWRHFDKRMPLK